MSEHTPRITLWILKNTDFIYRVRLSHRWKSGDYSHIYTYHEIPFCYKRTEALEPFLARHYSVELEKILRDALTIGNKHYANGEVGLLPFPIKFIPC